MSAAAEAARARLLSPSAMAAASAAPARSDRMVDVDSLLIACQDLRGGAPEASGRPLDPAELSVLPLL